MSTFFYVVYSSVAVRPFSPDELDELVRKSRDNNDRLGVTGMLLYKEGRFMQALEGEEAIVRALVQKITVDPRHHELSLLDEGFTDEREFEDTPMGFEYLGDPDGGREVSSQGESPKEFLDGGRAWRYLKLFRLVRT